MPVSVMRVPALVAASAIPKSATSALPVVQQDVLRLDVSVDDAVTVRVVERPGHLASDPDGVGHRKLLLAMETVAERLPLDHRHDVEEERVGLSRIVEREDVRVLEIGGGLDLGEKPLGTDDGGELRSQDLDGDSAVVPEVLGQVDCRHAARAELALDAVAVGQGGGETSDGIGHGPHETCGSVRPVARPTVREGVPRRSWSPSG